MKFPLLDRLTPVLAVLVSTAALAEPVPAASYAAAGLPPAVASAAAGIDAERIRSHVRFLSHDLLEGRGTGSRGGDIAAEYLATQFALAGLKPAGDDGSFLQKVRFAGSQTLDSTSLSFVPGGGEALPLKLMDDYVVSNQSLTETTRIDAPLVFVGYGIEAPEYQWDDYKGIDVRGKVVMVVVNEPPSTDPKFFKGEALTYYGRWTYKFEQAARKGAIGAVIVHRDDLASYPWSVVKSSWSNESVALADDPRQKLQAAAWLQLEVARLLLSLSGRDLDEAIRQAGTRDFKAFELPVRMNATINSRVRRFESSNVVAMLPGADKGAGRQALLYSAHYDHLGVVPDQAGDNIYNGAIDNATGCAVLLELARAYASMKASTGTPPPHPVLFAAVTAEEKGLLGSKYLGEHPPLPVGQIGLNLNFDSFAPFGVPESVKLLGSERLNFFPAVEKTAKAFRLAIEADSRPLAGSYYRSDHFSMARVGVPAFSVSLGDKFAGQTREWGQERAREYTARHYHQPSDEYRPDMDFTSSAEIARFGLALGWQALGTSTPIAWLPGDEFEATRLKSERNP
ncbi:MAG: M28 family peptidase [Gammaproteobacteria bacterium]|uniref:M28 family peptidase n=1 Tax=Nevskia sp. TaxID=1929292 RepID=UPI0040365FE2|nr:M28 family peptidase [Gammaproteobacteria bacterium]